MSASFKRIIKSGWVGFRRNSGLSLATVFIMVMAISLVTSLFLLQKTTDFLVMSLSEKVDMAVYFSEEPSSDEIATIQKELSGLPEVKTLEYISKEEALQKFIERHQGEEVILESLEEVGGNPLLASLSIKAFEATQYAAISSFLDSASFKDLIAFSLTSTISNTGIALSIVLAVVAVLIAFNTVRIAIFNSRDEIETMRLVGASNWFIRGPFLVQGMIGGLLAVLITFFVFGIALWFLSPKIDLVIPGLNLYSYFFGSFFMVIVLQLAAGVGLGACASWLAIRKYLKV
ncbi:MAG: Cell division protein [Parcubacteria group bacterium GW2011_GWF2_43_11]|nr:MAG: Cell division protein [Parcubacteria group bacterium GW2011_GWF2_43_11]